MEKVAAFVRKANDRGIRSAVSAAIEDVLPNKYGNRLNYSHEVFEQSSAAPESWGDQLWMWRHGYTPKSYQLYDFETYGSGAYLSDLDELSGWEINKPVQSFLNDKQRFYELLEDRGYGAHLPMRFGTLSDGILLGPGSDFISLLDSEGALVVKGRTGATGRNVHICRATSSRYSIDGEIVPADVLLDRLGDLDDYLVTEFCHQADYARSIYSETPNTIRLLTLTPRDGEPFIASAVHRLGTSLSGSVDNFSAGGLSASIADDGSLGPAVRYLDGDVSWHDQHPDTGSQIAGRTIPGWPSIRETILEIAASVPEFGQVGWDLIVVGDGEFRIIEGNSNSDTDLLQAHEPLLIDDDIRRFYANHLP